MDKRIERRKQLQRELESLTPNVYFQPPATIKMIYPCVVYHLVTHETTYANDDRYSDRLQCNLTVIDRSPDSELLYSVLNKFKYCTLTSTAVVDNINNFYLRLYF